MAYDTYDQGVALLLTVNITHEQREALELAIRNMNGAVISVIYGRIALAVFPETVVPKPEEFLAIPGVTQTWTLGEKPLLSERQVHPQNSQFEVKGVPIGSKSVVLIAGPCAIESEQQLFLAARAVKAAGADMLRGGAFKPRTRVHSFQGLGEDGLKLLHEVSQDTGLPTVTEVIGVEHLDLVARYADVLQIGSRSMQNFPLIRAAARTGLPVLLKRGFINTVDEWLASAEYLLSEGNERVILCERGCRGFDHETPHALDVLSIASTKKRSHLPVFVDPSHAAGRRELVPMAALAAIAAGADGLLIEVHPAPFQALSDGPQQLYPEDFVKLLPTLKSVALAVGRK